MYMCINNNIYLKSNTVSATNGRTSCSTRLTDVRVVEEREPRARLRPGDHVPKYPNNNPTHKYQNRLVYIHEVTLSLAYFSTGTLREPSCVNIVSVNGKAKSRTALS